MPSVGPAVRLERERMSGRYAARALVLLTAATLAAGSGEACTPADRTATGSESPVPRVDLRTDEEGAPPDPAESCLRLDPEEVADLDPTSAGQPLAGSGIEDMSPKDAGELLDGAGLCHTFRHIYNYADDPSSGFSEIWCSPPSGAIIGVSYATDGSIVVLVLDPQLHTPRPQPTDGWGC
jgi:hypothetical protein